MFNSEEAKVMRGDARSGRLYENRKTWDARGEGIAVNKFSWFGTFLVVTTAGCFVDDGQNPTTGSTQATESGAQTETGGTSTQTTTAEPTQTGTTNTTTGTECDPCEAEGGMEQGEACGGNACGMMERYCVSGCWSSWNCYGNDDNCGIWVLNGDYSYWQRYLLAGLGATEHMPTSPVVGAFDAHRLGQAYVFTSSTYHVLDLDAMTWVASGDRKQLLPELDGVEILAISSINDTQSPLEDALDTVTFFTPANIRVFDFDLSSEMFAFVELVNYNTFGPPEYAPNASALRAAWADAGTFPWEFSAAICGEPSSMLIDYGAFVTTEVHLQQLSYCFDFLAAQSFEVFPAFAVDFSPESAELIGASFWHEGLYVFRGAP